MTFVFDYDGTLHDSMKIYAPSFRKCCELMRRDGEDVREYSDEEIKRWIGMDVNSMWNDFRPELSQEKKQEYGGFIGEYMVSLINGGRAALYGSALDAVTEAKGFGSTVFLSSCKRSYMQAHIKAFGLDRYFDGFYCTEDYGFKPKHVIFEDIKKKYDGPYVIIGDRYSDMETAVIHKTSSIGCLYGYGSEDELKNADIKVKDIDGLKRAIRSMAEDQAV